MATPDTPAVRLGGIAVPRVGYQAFVLGLGLGVVWIVTRPITIYPGLAAFHDQALNALPNVLAPLLVIALFIERAVEVVITVWRAEGTKDRKRRLQRELEKERDGLPADPWAAQTAAASYRAQSQRLAFYTGLTIALFIALMGIRAIEMLVQRDVILGFPAWQQSVFFWVDVSVTAMLLAGGAEGIHRVVDAFTSFIDPEKGRDRLAPVPEPAGAGEGG
jgi:hypothetical protein